MIHYYATTPHLYPFGSFAEQWAPHLPVNLVSYGELDLAAAREPGLHILTDFERLTPDELAFARRLQQRLRGRGRHVLGNPRSWNDRHDLLAGLQREGINTYRAHRVHELGSHVRFPVFLRWEHRHRGSIGQPLQSEAALHDALVQLEHEHGPEAVQRLLVTEWVDARSPDGLFRKYSVQRIGDTYFARHLLVGEDWVTKTPDVVTSDTLAEEAAFVANPPDLDLIRRAFELAGSDYGRIDYGYVGARLQVWEINTNAMLAPLNPDPQRVDGLRERAAEMAAELLRLSPAGSPSGHLFRTRERSRWAEVQRTARRLDPYRR